MTSYINTLHYITQTEKVKERERETTTTNTNTNTSSSSNDDNDSHKNNNKINPTMNNGCNGINGFPWPKIHTRVMK